MEFEQLSFGIQNNGLHAWLKRVSLEQIRLEVHGGIDGIVRALPIPKVNRGRVWSRKMRNTCWRILYLAGKADVLPVVIPCVNRINGPLGVTE
jgi:hypothetical protein